MEREIKKIDPLDIGQERAIGISLPFSAGAVFNQTFQTKDSIKANLINFFLTAKGERFLNPNFGSLLKTYLFQQNTDRERQVLLGQIKEELSVYFPKLTIKTLNITEGSQEGILQLDMNYEINNTGIVDEVILNFYI